MSSLYTFAKKYGMDRLRVVGFKLWKQGGSAKQSDVDRVERSRAEPSGADGADGAERAERSRVRSLLMHVMHYVCTM